MSINQDKCKFNFDVINYLGFQMTKQGISLDTNLLKKIEQSSLPPQIKKDLESFWGLANFYSRYLPKYSELIEPSNDLKKKRIVSLNGVQNRRELSIS